LPAAHRHKSVPAAETTLKKLSKAHLAQIRRDAPKLIELLKQISK
jgi:hypothetical protein